MSKSVRVAYHQEADSWWAESPDVEGFVASGSDLSEVRHLVREGLEFYLDEEIELEEQAPWATGVVVETHFSSAAFGASVTSNVWAALIPRNVIDHLSAPSFEVQGSRQPVRA